MQIKFILSLHIRGIISLKAMVAMSFTSMGVTTTMVMATSIMAITTMVDTRVTMEDSKEIITMDITMAMVNLVTIPKARRTCPR